jgi:hypothetical protein
MKKYLFCHIPKTAGTMFSDILRRNFGHRFFRDNQAYANIAYEPWHLEDALRIRPHQCFASHIIRATSLPSNAEHDYVAMAFVRSPVQHALSGYFDLRGRVARQGHPTTEFSIAELTDKWRSSGFAREFAYTFSQFEWLYPKVENKGDRLEADLAAGRLLLFTTEAFNDALIYLEQRFPEDFTDCAYPAKLNMAARDYVPTDDDIAAVSSLPWISENLALHQRASAFTSKLADEVDMEIERRRFLSRCNGNQMLASSARPNRLSLKNRIRRAASVLTNGY